MRNAIITLFLASAAMPAMAQSADQERRGQARAERVQERSDRQAERQVERQAPRQVEQRQVEQRQAEPRQAEPRPMEQRQAEPRQLERPQAAQPRFDRQMVEHPQPRPDAQPADRGRANRDLNRGRPQVDPRQFEQRQIDRRQVDQRALDQQGWAQRQADRQRGQADRQQARPDRGAWQRGEGRENWQRHERPAPGVYQQPNWGGHDGHGGIGGITTNIRVSPPVQDYSHRWTRDWRHDDRYDWQNWRNHHRSIFNIGFYYDPYGYGYQRPYIGYGLDSYYYQSDYWLDDPWQYRLPPVYGPYRWVRYYDDALLVDVFSGQVVDVLYNFFW